VFAHELNTFLQQEGEEEAKEGGREGGGYDSRVAWFAHVTCCRGKEAGASAGAADAAGTAAGAAGAATLPPMAGSTHLWRPEDDLPFYPPPPPLPGAAAAGGGGGGGRVGCALQVNERKGGLVVVAVPIITPPAPATGIAAAATATATAAAASGEASADQAALWRLGAERKEILPFSSPSLPSSSSSLGPETSLWTCFLIKSSLLLLVMGGVIASWRGRQGMRAGGRRGREEGWRRKRMRREKRRI